MHLQELLEELTNLYGEPIAVDNWTHRWEVMPNGKRLATHICLVADEKNRRATVWVFDPTSTPVYLKLNGNNDLASVLTTIKTSVPNGRHDGTEA